MTLPSEEYKAICSATRFLYDLLDPKKTPRVPKSIRQEARRILKHMPLDAVLLERYKSAIRSEPGFQPSLMARHYPDPYDAPIL